MTFAFAVILLFIAVPFVLLLLDLAPSRAPEPPAQTPEHPDGGRRGVIAPGDGMVYRRHR